MVTNLAFTDPANKMKVVIDTMGTGHPITGDMLCSRSAANVGQSFSFVPPGGANEDPDVPSGNDPDGFPETLGPFFPNQVSPFPYIVIPIGSLYRDIRYGTLWMKLTDLGVAADWKLLSEVAPNS